VFPEKGKGFRLREIMKEVIVSSSGDYRIVIDYKKVAEDKYTELDTIPFGVELTIRKK